MTQDRESRISWAGYGLAAIACGMAFACGGMTTVDGPAGSGGSDGGISTGGTLASGGTVFGAGGSNGVDPLSTQCDIDSDCVVDTVSCCACDPVTADQLKAVNAQSIDGGPACNCDPCGEVPEVERTWHYFVAQCQEETCTLVDIRDDYTECNTGEDCVLYQGNGCCAGCGDSGFIAVSSFEFLGDECETVQCDACDPMVPEGLSAQCVTGQCQVVQE